MMFRCFRKLFKYDMHLCASYIFHDMVRILNVIGTNDVRQHPHDPMPVQYIYNLNIELPEDCIHCLYIAPQLENVYLI